MLLQLRPGVEAATAAALLAAFRALATSIPEHVVAITAGENFMPDRAKGFTHGNVNAPPQGRTARTGKRQEKGVAKAGRRRWRDERRHLVRAGRPESHARDF